MSADSPTSTPPTASLSLTTIPVAGLPLPLPSPTTHSPPSPSRLHKTPRATPPVQPILRSNSPTLIAAMHTWLFPPLSPRPPLLCQDSSQQKVNVLKQYQSGVTMAAQRIKANLCKEEPKRSAFAQFPRNANLSLAGPTALVAGVPRSIRSPSLAITPSPLVTVRTPSTLARVSLPLHNARMMPIQPWTPSTRYLSPSLSLPASLAIGLSTNSIQRTTLLLLAAWYCLLGQGSDLRSKWSRVFTDALCSIELLS